MLTRTVQGRVTIGLLLTSLALGGLMFACRQSVGSPEQTLATFLTAAGAGDAATACAQLSPQDQRVLAQGSSCQRAIGLDAAFYKSKLVIGTVKARGRSATATATLRGRPALTLQLASSGGKWLIASQQRVATIGTGGSGTAAWGPSQTRVAAVAQCLDTAFGPVDNAGYDGIGGVPHNVLGVDVGGYSVAEVDVFDSTSAASSCYRGIKALDATLTTKLVGGSVVVYVRPVTGAQRGQIEGCA